jgi:FtsZ-interacting cell division protein ZipA
MKNKVLIIVGVVLLIIIVVGVWFYLDKTENSKLNQNQNQEEQTNGNMLVKDGFSIILPKGWMESQGTAEGITALAFDPQEQITEEAAKKISFASYLSIGQDSSQEKSMSDYVVYTKQELQKALGAVEFTNEQSLTINSKEAYALEMRLSQENINFKILMVLIKGDYNDVWVVSFNTLDSMWNGYKDAFYNSAKSFIVKKLN